MPSHPPRVELYDIEREQALQRLDALARLMDSAFLLPGTNIRLGLDGILGLLPVVGDLVSGAISSYIIWEARRLEASRWVIGRMAMNTLIDTTLGAIPVVGDAFDVMFRTNVRNLALLRQHFARKGSGRSNGGPVLEGEAVGLS